MAKMELNDETAAKFMEKALTTTGEIDSLRMRALILGDFGVGKTTMAKTCPAPLILDPEGGTMSLRDQNLPRVKISSWDDVFQALQWVYRAKHSHQTLVIDDLHALQEYDIQYIMKEERKDRMTIDMWGIAKRHGLVLATWIKNIQVKRDIHVVCFCNSRTETDSDGKVLGIVPDLQGGFREEVCRSFNLIGYLEARECTKEEKDEGKPPIIRRVLVWPYGKRVKAKDRYTPEGFPRSFLDQAPDGEKPGVCLPDVGLWIKRVEQAELTSLAPEPADEKQVAQSISDGDLEMPEMDPEIAESAAAAARKAEETKRAREKAELEAAERRAAERRAAAAQKEKEATEEAEPADELPPPAELKAAIVGTFQGAIAAAKGTPPSSDQTSYALKIQETIKAHLAANGVEKLTQLDDSLALDKIIQEVNSIPVPETV